MAIDTERNRRLIRSYLAGEITPFAWQQHLTTEPGLRDQWLGNLAPRDLEALRREADRRDFLALEGRWPGPRAFIEDLALVVLMMVGAGTLVFGALWALGILHWLGVL